MADVEHRTVRANGLRFHVAEQGEGPLVLLCHGFPESWYSWRHQLGALAAAGYRAVAPDLRGYGRSSAPLDIGAYTQLHLVGDVIGLIAALGEDQAVVVGHDWGAPVAWNAALLRPDVVRAVGALSVPYLPRGRSMPTGALRALSKGHFNYMLYFQDPGVAEAEIEADVRRWLLGFFFSASGDMPADRQRWGRLPADAVVSDALDVPEEMPAWLTEADLDHYAGEFERTGFRGPLNWYRNLDRTWELLAAFEGAPVRVPALFVGGTRDGVVAANRAAIDALPATVPDLWRSELLEGCGHWTQQERPDEVNRLLLEFLAGVSR